MVILLLGGDVMLGRTFNDLYGSDSKLSYSYPWGNLLPILKKADFFGCNLETTITTSTDKYPGKIFNYKMNPKMIKILTSAHIKYCSLANNHILDFQINGLKDTIQHLKKANIKHAGAGTSIKKAMTPAFINIKGIKIGFLSAADHYSYWKSNTTKAGIWYIPIKDGNVSIWKSVFEHVKKVKQDCDYLVFSLHWNNNYVNSISPNFKKFGRLLIDSGVDIIHGHSPHHLLPIEKYKNGFIFYSLGDLIDDYAINLKYRNDLACLVELKITKSGLDLNHIYPTIISNFQVNLATNNKDKSFIKKTLGT